MANYEYLDDDIFLDFIENRRGYFKFRLTYAYISDSPDHHAMFLGESAIFEVVKERKCVFMDFKEDIVRYKDRWYPYIVDPEDLILEEGEDESYNISSRVTGFPSRKEAIGDCVRYLKEYKDRELKQKRLADA